MSRDEMVSKRDAAKRKKECYANKITRNGAVITSINTGMGNCATYKSNIGAYSTEANIFSELYERNDEMFNSAELTTMTTMLNDLGTHLEAERSAAEQDESYWQGEIDAYDRAQEEAAAAAAQQEQDGN